MAISATSGLLVLWGESNIIQTICPEMLYVLDALITKAMLLIVFRGDQLVIASAYE